MRLNFFACVAYFGEMIQPDKFLFKLGFFILFLGGCTAQKTKTLNQTTTELHDLWSATWLADADTNRAARMPFIELNTTTQKAYGTTSCNTFSADFKTGKFSEIVFSNILSSKMYCPESFEKLFLQHLKNTSSYSRNELNLTFYGHQKPLIIFKKVD